MCLRMCLPQVSSPRGEWSLKTLQTVWNVLNSDVSCTEAEGIPPHGRHYLGARTPPRLTERTCTARVSPWGSEKPETLKNSRVVRGWITSWFMEDPIWLPNSHPNPTEHRLLPMKAKSGEGLGERKVLPGRGMRVRGAAGWGASEWETPPGTWETCCWGGRGSGRWERANAPARPGGPRSEGKDSQRRRSRPEAVRRRCGYSPGLLWERNQAAASVRAHTCTEPVIPSEAACYRDHRGLDRWDGPAVEWESPRSLGSWWGPRTPSAARSKGD